MSKAIQKVLRASAFVIENVSEIEDIIFKLYKNEAAAEDCGDIKKFSPSKKELDALLGN